MFKVPEDHRFTQKGHSMSSDKSYGCNGIFIIPHPKIRDYFYQVIASDQLDWEHVSVSIFTQKKLQKKNGVDRTPTWTEMCFIKDLFWDDTDTVIQYHPAKSTYVNMHKYVLHIWKPKKRRIPVPPVQFV